VTDTAQPPTTIQQMVRIAASPQTVWGFWTDAGLLARWWGVDAEVVAEPGGIYRVVMEENGPAMRGTFTELDPPHRLVFTFGWEHNAAGEPLAPGSTQVEVTLAPDEGGTLLTLRHSELPAVQASEHEKGWALFLGERLVAAAEAGTEAGAGGAGSS